MKSDFFNGIKRWNIERNGTSRPLPYLYYDNLSMAAVFTASTVKVRKLIPHDDLLPMELTPGRCLVAFAAFEYRKTDHDPYNEFSISFLVSYRKKSTPLITIAKTIRSGIIPSYVWQLPVTTEDARAGGADLFGYPKFIADIKFLKGNDWIECSLEASGSEILRMTGRVISTKPGKQMRYVTYPIENGILMSVNTLVNPIEFGQSFRKHDLSLEIGRDHHICQVIREIELGKNPLVYQFSPSGESILFPARNLKDN